MDIGTLYTVSYWKGLSLVLAKQRLVLPQHQWKTNMDTLS